MPIQTSRNSYSVAGVTATYNAVGGLIGWNQTDSSVDGVQYNFSSGTVSITSVNTSIGGFIGYHSNCNSCSTRGNDNYWDSVASNQSTSEGGESLVSGLTYIDAKIADSYLNWDFDSTWIVSGNLNDGYPFIRGNNPIGSYKHHF